MPPLFQQSNRENIWVLIGTASTQTAPTSYIVPRNKNFLYILAIGNGAGGGGGFSGAAGTARGGGGGGASGGQASIVVPTYALPDVIYVNAGPGSDGGAAGLNAQQGQRVSTVTVVPLASSTVANNKIIVTSSGNVSSNGGTAGSVSAGGAGGTTTSIPVISDMSLAGSGFLQLFINQAGVAGGAHTGAAGGQLIVPTTGLRVTGGAGGAGTTSADFAGGFVTNNSNTYLVGETFTNPIAGSVDGSTGRSNLFSQTKPFFGLGGNGGSSSNTGIGGRGGDGGIGCGGGGGGAGTTGGRGGDGGPGMVMILAF